MHRPTGCLWAQHLCIGIDHLKDALAELNEVGELFPEHGDCHPHGAHVFPFGSGMVVQLGRKKC